MGKIVNIYIDDEGNFTNWGFFLIVILCLFCPLVPLHAEILYSQDNKDNLDSGNCYFEGQPDPFVSCGTLNGTKTHSEQSSTTASVTMDASSTVYASFYAGMDWNNYGSFVTQPKVRLYIGSCIFVGDIDKTILAVTDLNNPAYFTNVPMTAPSGTCTNPALGDDITFSFGEGNWNGQISSYHNGVGDHLRDYMILSTEPIEGGSQCGGGLRSCISFVSPNPELGEIATSTPFDLSAIGTIVTKDLVGINHLSGDPKKTLKVKWSYGLISRNFASCPVSVIQDAACALPFGQSMTNFSEDIAIYSNTTSDFIESTTSPGTDQIGLYTLKVTVEKPTTYFGLTSIFGIGFGYSTIAATTTKFTIATSTPYERYLAFLMENAGNFNATSTEAALTTCMPVPGYFNLRDCINILFVPLPQDYDELISTVHDGILTKAPVGYLTRLATILEGNATSTATSTLPAINYTFPDLPGTELNGLNWTIDMQEMLEEGSSTMAQFTDPASGKSVREIIEPYLLLFLAITALSIIFHDIMGIRASMGRGAQKK